MSVLDKILATKRDEVAAAKLARPFIHVDSMARASARYVHDFAGALRRPPGQPLRVLAEIKRASPSAGAIRAGADPVEIARAYHAGGAAAISVLTDKQYFDGDLPFLTRVRDEVPLPLLRKDFIIDPYQIAEARQAGADAILLIVAALDPVQLAELYAAAKQYKLAALVEVHDLREAEVALALGAPLLGVNHRDLKTFTIDMTLSAQVARIVPAGTVLVAESGIKSTADALALDPRVDAVLIGEQLMRAASPEAALHELCAALRKSA